MKKSIFEKEGRIVLEWRSDKELFNTCLGKTGKHILFRALEYGPQGRQYFLTAPYAATRYWMSSEEVKQYLIKRNMALPKEVRNA